MTFEEAKLIAEILGEEPPVEEYAEKAEEPENDDSLSEALLSTSW